MVLFVVLLVLVALTLSRRPPAGGKRGGKRGGADESPAPVPRPDNLLKVDECGPPGAAGGSADREEPGRVDWQAWQRISDNRVEPPTRPLTAAQRKSVRTGRPPLGAPKPWTADNWALFQVDEAALAQASLRAAAASRLAVVGALDAAGLATTAAQRKLAQARESIASAGDAFADGVGALNALLVGTPQPGFAARAAKPLLKRHAALARALKAFKKDYDRADLSDALADLAAKRPADSAASPGLESKVRTLEDDKRRLEKGEREAKADLEACRRGKGDATYLREAKERCERDRRDSQKRADDYLRDLEQCRRDLQACRGRPDGSAEADRVARRLREEKEALERDLRASRDRQRELESIVAALNESLREAEARAREAPQADRSEVRRLMQEIERLRGEARDAGARTADLERCQAQLRETEATLNDVLNSHSGRGPPSYAE